MRLGFGAVVGALVVAVLLATLALFTVDQRESAIVFQLGEIKEVITEPGLRAKWPLIQNVRYFDKRILTIDEPDTERFVTSEKKNLLVDSFVKWRIADVRQYYISMNGDEARALRYSRDEERDLIGIIERVGERRWRMVFPRPHFESLLDVIELTPVR